MGTDCTDRDNKGNSNLPFLNVGATPVARPDAICADGDNCGETRAHIGAPLRVNLLYACASGFPCPIPISADY